jgi:hypothetical protein
VRRQLAAGALLPTDYAWSEGATAWVQLANLPSLLSPPAEPTAPPLPPPAASVIEPVVHRTRQTSGLAVASMVLGILSATFLLPAAAGIGGVICGHMARARIRRSGETLAGDGMAVAGLITSYIGLFVILLVVVFAFAMIFAGMALPIFGATQIHARQTKAIGQAREIATACHLYATEHQGKFPKTLEELVPKYLPDRKVFVCPLSGPTVAQGYEYFGGTDTDPGEKILIMSKYQDRDGKRVIVSVDSSARFDKPPSELLPPGGR